jgi:hypothetical protein
MEDWTVLETYRSQSEAVVVESFLRAKGFEVKLLDSLGQVPARGIGNLRLLVRAADAERARAAMSEAERATHLDIVDDLTPPPSIWLSYDRTAVAMILALLLLVIAVLSWLR